jgi:hypothetical protein
MEDTVSAQALVPRYRIPLAWVLAIMLSLLLLTTFPGAARAATQAARGCTLTLYRPYKSGSSVVGNATLSCTGNSGGTFYVEVWQYRGLGHWSRKASASYYIPPNSIINRGPAWRCAAGTGTQTYETRAHAFVTFKLPNGQNTVLEYKDYDGPNAAITCP